MTGPPQPRLKAFSLWQKTSAAGNTYLMGRFGGVRVLVLSNRDRAKRASRTGTSFSSTPKSRGAA
jgi:hypothetical protein